MTVRELIEKLSQLDPDMPVARAVGEYDDWYEDVFFVTVEPLTEDGIILRKEDREPEDDAETTPTCVFS